MINDRFLEGLPVKKGKTAEETASAKGWSFWDTAEYAVYCHFCGALSQGTMKEEDRKSVV